MIGPEDSWSPIVWMLVQPVDPGSPDHALPVPNEEVIQYQAWQGMKGMSPGWQ